MTSVSHVQLVFTTTHYPHFTDKEIEVQKSRVTDMKLTNWKMAELRFDPGLLCHQILGGVVQVSCLDNPQPRPCFFLQKVPLYYGEWCSLPPTHESHTSEPLLPDDLDTSPLSEPLNQKRGSMGCDPVLLQASRWTEEEGKGRGRCETG
jgi:hypothetical protein